MMRAEKRQDWDWLGYWKGDGCMEGLARLSGLCSRIMYALFIALLLALLVLFSGRRVQAGMNISPNNAAAQTAFQAQVAYDETKTMEKLPPLSGNAVRSVAVFVAAAVVLAGFGVSLLF